MLTREGGDLDVPKNASATPWRINNKTVNKPQKVKADSGGNQKNSLMKVKKQRDQSKNLFSPKRLRSRNNSLHVQDKLKNGNVLEMFRKKAKTQVALKKDFQDDDDDLY